MRARGKIASDDNYQTKLTRKYQKRGAAEDGPPNPKTQTKKSPPEEGPANQKTIRADRDKSPYRPYKAVILPRALKSRVTFRGAFSFCSGFGWVPGGGTVYIYIHMTVKLYINIYTHYIHVHALIRACGNTQYYQGIC